MSEVLGFKKTPLEKEHIDNMFSGLSEIDRDTVERAQRSPSLSWESRERNHVDYVADLVQNAFNSGNSDPRFTATRDLASSIFPETANEILGLFVGKVGNNEFQDLRRLMNVSVLSPQERLRRLNSSLGLLKDESIAQQIQADTRRILESCLINVLSQSGFSDEQIVNDIEGIQKNVNKKTVDFIRSELGRMPQTTVNPRMERYVAEVSTRQRKEDLGNQSVTESYSRFLEKKNMELPQFAVYEPYKKIGVHEQNYLQSSEVYSRTPVLIDEKIFHRLFSGPSFQYKGVEKEFYFYLNQEEHNVFHISGVEDPDSRQGISSGFGHVDAEEVDFAKSAPPGKYVGGVLHFHYDQYTGFSDLRTRPDNTSVGDWSNAAITARNFRLDPNLDSSTKNKGILVGVWASQPQNPNKFLRLYRALDSVSSDPQALRTNHHGEYGNIEPIYTRFQLIPCLVVQKEDGSNYTADISQPGKITGQY